MWNHFMIKIEWVEEVLGLILSGGVFKWDELFREMSIYSIDRTYAYMSFKSLKLAFFDFNLINSIEDERIELIFQDLGNFKHHLKQLLFKQSPGLIELVNNVVRKGESLDFEKWNSIKGNHQSGKSAKKRYIQQLEMLQYLGFGVIMDKYRFVFFKNLEKDKIEFKELMKIILRYNDPRVLGNKYSQHPEGDKIALTLGKDFLTLIPENADFNHIDSDSIFSADGRLDVVELDVQLRKFNANVYRETGFKDSIEFDNMVVTIKHLFDIIFHGRSAISKDQLDDKGAELLMNALAINKIRISQHKKKELAASFRAVSRLNYNSLFYNRYLHRPSRIFSIEEKGLGKDPMSIDINLRLLKSSVSLKAIFASVKTIYSVTQQLSGRKEVDKSNQRTGLMHEHLSSFLPADTIERHKQFDRLANLYFLKENNRSALMQFNETSAVYTDGRLREVVPLVRYLNNERLRRNKTIVELENIRKYLIDLYNKNLIELGIQYRAEQNQLGRLNLIQLLNMIDDQKIQLEKLRRFKYNKELIEHLQSLLEETQSESASESSTTTTKDNRLRFAIEKLVGQFDSYSK